MSNYTDMTDEEYDALDEELIRIIPKLGPNCTVFKPTRNASFVIGNCKHLNDKRSVTIVNGNALRIDWESVVPKYRMKYSWYFNSTFYIMLSC